jgi:GTP cyclohydrolase I
MENLSTPISKAERLERVERGYRMILEGLGVDLDDAHFQDTPRRAAKAMFKELCGGLTSDEPLNITTFPSTGPSQMIKLGAIPVKSLCAHHLLPFIGTATVAYIPGKGEILGLSKLSRIVEHFARRPQVQEDLTNGIADYVFNLIRTPTASESGREEKGGCGVIIKASHMCMQLRGVNHAGDMITSALRGNFHNEDVKTEFLYMNGQAL